MSRFFAYKVEEDRFRFRLNGKEHQIHTGRPLWYPIMTSDGYERDENGDIYYREGKFWSFLSKPWMLLLPLLGLVPAAMSDYLDENERGLRVSFVVLSGLWTALIISLIFALCGFGKPVPDKTNLSANITRAPQLVTNAPAQRPTTAPTSAPTPIPAPTYQAGVGGTTTGTGTETGLSTGTSDGTLGTATEETVYFTPNGEFYHKQPVCGVMTNGTASPISYAQNLGKTACPTCFGMGDSTGTTTGTTTASGANVFYATSDGTWFHKTATSCGMKNASPISRADAEARGQYACPKCLGVYSRDGGNWYHRTPTCSSGFKNGEIVSLTIATKQRNQTACPYCMNNSEDTTIYWHTKTGDSYHLDKTCQGMKGAVECTVAQAVKLGQGPCPKCIGDKKGVAYYCTDDGKYYHTDKTCTGMKNAKQVTKAAAENNGKTPCPTCVGTPTTSTNNKVYFTTDGTWYHVKKDCQGMKNPSLGTVEQAKKLNKTACPECVASTSAKVYGRKDGQYYHIVSDCTGMKNASQITVKTAQKAGLSPCPVCIGGKSGSASTAKTNTSTNAKVEVYCTDGGDYYHSYATCTGMKNAKATTIAVAEKMGKTPCPDCMKASTGTKTVSVSAGKTSTGDTIEVYCTSGGTWYHANATCTDMKNAKGTTIEKALNMSKTACPVCIGTTSKSDDKSVYATKYGTYYHLKKNCLGMSGATSLTVASAVASGKYACPVCVGATDTYVFLTKNGDNYHAKSDCNGMKGAVLVRLKDAVAMGKDFCPDCIGSSSAIAKKYGSKVSGSSTDGKEDSTNENAAGYDGFYVYYTEKGTWYHSKRYCGTMSGAEKNTMAAAIKAGKTACPTCVNTSSENIAYCRPDSRFYHTNSRCSGMTGASKVTISIALANGKTACPTCAGGDLHSGGSSSEDSSEKVYIASNNDYYHKSSTACGIENAKATTKDKAVSTYGKVPCPKCYNIGSSSSGSFEKLSVLTSVYWTTNGVNYHINPTCRGMTGAKESTVAQAKAAGKTACSRCYSTEHTTRVFTTEKDEYFHNVSVCGGEKKTIATSYTKAVQAGKKGCPSCTGKNIAHGDKTFATSASTYYHKDSKCTREDLTGATLVTITKAETYGKTKCPSCYK